MKIEIAKPPMFDQILAAFPKAAESGVIFAWGDTIYNPSGIVIPRPLLAHEEKHGSRQMANHAKWGEAAAPMQWWGKYIEDPEFRYNEELHAHAAEFKEQMRIVHDRNDRAKLMMSTAQRLLAPLYNYGIPKSLNQALCDMRWAVQQ
jgi:hypothetical protein